MRITAAITEGPGRPFVLRAAELEPPRDDEVLVRIAGVGICHTDLVVRDWDALPAPAVLGHEGAGVVEAVGRDVRKVTAGDRVILTFRSCGACHCCATRDPAYCHYFAALNSSGARPDGSMPISVNGARVRGNFFGQSSFATHALAYERNVVKMPADVPLALMGPLGCGVQTGAGAVLRSLECQPGSSLLIVGGGTVGLSAVMAATLRGCSRVIVVEPHAKRRALALDIGATDAVDPATEVDLAATVRAMVPGGVSYVLDTSGHPPTQAKAMDALATKGVFGLIGVAPAGSGPPGDMNTIMARGQTVKGIIEGDSDPDTFLPELVDLHRRGDLPFDRLITPFPFDQINAAIEAQHRGDAVKIVLMMPGQPDTA